MESVESSRLLSNPQALLPFAQQSGSNGLTTLSTTPHSGASSLPSLNWARRVGNSQTEQVRYAGADAAGNVYLVGSFAGSTDFAPTVSGFNLAKLDRNGNLLWTKLYPDAGGNAPWQGVLVDNAGNLYLTGFFRGTIDFDPGNGVAELAATGNYSAFLTKLDTNGNFVWARNIADGLSSPTTNAAIGIDLAIDSSGNLYTEGVFYGTVDFNPGSGVANLTAPSTEPGGIFLSKLNSQGNFVWARQVANMPTATVGNTIDVLGLQVAVDSTGNVYTANTFSGSLLVNPGSQQTTLTSSQTDVLVTRYDANGSFTWGHRFAGTGAETVGDLAASGTGDLYLTGSFTGTTDFDPGAGTTTLTSVGQDAYVVRLNGSGGLVWVRQFGGSEADQGTAIAIGSNGNLYAAGSFQGSADFDPGPATTSLTSVGSSDAFIVRLTTAGAYSWAGQQGGAGSDTLADMAADASGNLYTAGTFTGVADFDPSAGTTFLTSTPAGQSNGQPLYSLDGYVTKFSLPNLTITDVEANEGRLGVTPLTFTVTLDQPLQGSTTFRYRTADDTATVADRDYVATTGTLAFAPGETVKTITINVLGDRKLEGDELVRVELVNLDGSAITSATGTIRNDDNNRQADFSGDGQADILLRSNSTNQNQIWVLNGTSVDTIAVLPGARSNAWRVAATADFNGDGNLDVLYRNITNGENEIWLMNGTTLSTVVRLPSANPVWAVVATGDFDRDGQTDILWRHSKTGQNSFWFLDGTTYRSSISLRTVHPDWAIVASGDFNGDGKLDLLLRNSKKGLTTIWLLDRYRYRSSVNLRSVNSSWSVAGVEDFDHDGQLDIVWRQPQTASIHIWLMDGTRYRSSAILPTQPGEGWVVAKLNDYNRDGMIDLLWHNQQTGRNEIWTLNHGSRLAIAPLPNLAGANWAIV